MLDKRDIDTLGRALAELQDEFTLPTFELVTIMEKHFYGRPWKRIIARGREEANGKGKDSTASSKSSRDESDWSRLPDS